MKLILSHQRDADATNFEVQTDDGETILAHTAGRGREFRRHIEDFTAAKNIKLKKIDEFNYEVTEKSK